ncbi:MAG: cell surface protein SprA [Mucilaginibacter polytrichastri]|nr:cell surface protein SprA [Mucilaginibacter polytrichastri]
MAATVTLVLFHKETFAQQDSGRTTPTDSILIKPVSEYKSNALKAREGLFTPDPPNLERIIEYDVKKGRYMLIERVGNRLYREPRELSFTEYLKLKQEMDQKAYFRKEAESYADSSQQPGFIPQIQVRSRTFEQIFGGSKINIIPQGSADLTFAGQVNKNANPLFNTRQRNQFNFDFNQRIQMNVEGQIGEKLRISTNYNTEAQFQFENQFKLDYTGKPDEIVQKIEAGMVSMPLNTTLISGSQSLFGVKTLLRFGKLDVTSIFSQQRSESKEITIKNGAQQGEFRITSDNYDANRHYFLAQYFRNNYNRSLANLPVITSNIQITKIEVWVTNRTNSVTDSRDILALLDLGENAPYNPSFAGGGSAYPAGFRSPGFTRQSNNLLQVLPQGARQTNSNDVANFFNGTGRTDNYAKLTYARKLTETEFTLNAQLGYISLNYALNNDEVLAVAYRYTVGGQEYQVGELSTDRPQVPGNPEVLYVKLLKNELLKTNLPTWDLMMKNIYSLGAFQISPNDFRLQIARLDESGIEKPIMAEGQNTTSRLWLQLTGLDRLNPQNDRQPDGYFDFVEGITIDSQNGRITFPVIEPFGSDLRAQFLGSETALIDRYVYQPLYDSTRAIAQQFFPNLNRYVIKGTYQSNSGSEFQLNAINIPPGSVTVTSGSIRLTEGTDYTVDYNSGRIRILNQALLISGTPINVKLENNELFGVQQRSLFGSRFDYRLNEKTNIGATVMHLKEQPITQKINLGEESIANTMVGADINYSSDSRFLTRLVDKIPFISTKEPSSVNFAAEFARLFPGHPNALNFAGSKNGTSYIDDFEGSRSLIDLKNANGWQISATPQMFTESQNTNDLSYGYNRALLAFYNIDPIFYNRSNSQAPPIASNRTEMSNHYVREVLEQEVFPYRQSSTGQQLNLPTLDLAYYPKVRGPYNFTTTQLNPDGTLQNPQDRWGGIFRRLETNDFESYNIEFIEFWVLDPFIYNPNAAGGDLYFNLGSITEDILKDGRKGLENGLPVDGDETKVDRTVWGKVPKLQPVIQAFDNDPAARTLQDVGLNGLSSAEERIQYAPQIQALRTQLVPEAAQTFENDPATDTYRYYQGPLLNQANAGVLERYKYFNGTEGNSKTAEQSRAELGLETSANTQLPDGEDANRDNSMSIADEYYQYRVSMRPQDMQVGRNFITDRVPATVRLQNGQTQTVNWYQFRIPIANYTSRVGNIQDFKAIRFMRIFMTNFADTSILRFARMQLVRGEWRRFNAENNSAKVIADPSIPSPGLDNSTLDVGTVNIEENGNRTPIPYVVPPGIQRQRDFNNYRTDTRLNEQSLALTINNLRDGYGRAAYRTFTGDYRQYKRMEMYIHAEGAQLRDHDLTAFIRLGIDYQDNYYEYEKSLFVTPQGTRDPNQIWPDANRMDIELAIFQRAKLARNRAINAGTALLNQPFLYVEGETRVTIKGQPDLSQVRTIMLGVKNPYRGNSPNADDGLDKSGIVWFNELRLTDFDENGGWAATARMNAKLADFGDVSFSGYHSTVGFGSIEKRVSERQRSDDTQLDVAANLELGKFLPEKSGVKIPLYVNYSGQMSNPQYDPRQPDIKLKDVYRDLTAAQQDSVREYAQSRATRRSINLTNVHKERTNPDAKAKIYEVENLSATYAYSDFNQHDFITQSAIQRMFKIALAYNFTTQASYYEPMKKLVKSNWLALLRDVNFSILPSRLNFRIDLDRMYSENTLRNNDPLNYIPIPTTFNKNFLITQVYGIGWNISKSLQLDIDATNLAVVDEPAGRINGLKRDTLWENLKRLGRTTDYGHTINLNYSVPVNKLPGMDWTTLIARYSARFDWKTEPLITLNDPALNFGNTIQNGKTVQINPTLNFAGLYNKFGFIRKASQSNPNDSTRRGGSFLVTLLTSIKNINAAYTRTDGTFLPGYLPKSRVFGRDPDFGAPGFGFLIGSQADIRQRAIDGGWITTDTLQNQLYVTTLAEDLQLRGVVEPVRDLRIELIASRTKSQNFQTNFKYVAETGSFENLSPITYGNYSVSVLSLGTAFAKESGINNISSVYQRFLANRQVVSQRLGAINPNSTGPATEGFSDGYSRNNQDVVVNAFLAAYQNKDVGSMKLGAFPNIPIPNWQITYNGLSRLKLFQELFDSFDLRHGYRSAYSVNSFNTLVRYQEVNGGAAVRDESNDFLPFYQFGQVSLFEQFVPLLGCDIRFKNSMTANLEYRKSRSLNLSLANSQLAQLNENIIVFGFGYRTTKFRFPLGLFGTGKTNNDVDFKIDFALRDNKTIIYRADVSTAEISSGAQNITVRPTIDYIMNQRFNLRLFYDSNITRPYTSQTFNTAYTNFGVSLRLLLNN